MFYLIGAGLNSFKDLALKGLELLKNSDYVFMERYTSILSDEDVEELEKLSGKEIVELSRSELETQFEELVLKKAVNKKVALITAGDPLTATTHIEFLKSCRENNVEYKVVHGSSIHSSICETGLHVYKFGKSCSIPYPEKDYKPTSFFDVIADNYRNNTHTLVFLDIKQNLGKYMTVNEGLKILLDISKKRKSFFNDDTEIIGIARLGSDDQIIKFGAVKELLNFDFGANPHVLIIPRMNDIEREYVASLYQ